MPVERDEIIRLTGLLERDEQAIELTLQEDLTIYTFFSNEEKKVVEEAARELLTRSIQILISDNEVYNFLAETTPEAIHLSDKFTSLLIGVELLDPGLDIEGIKEKLHDTEFIEPLSELMQTLKTHLMSKSYTSFYPDNPDGYIPADVDKWQADLNSELWSLGVTTDEIAMLMEFWEKIENTPDSSEIQDGNNSTATFALRRLLSLDENEAERLGKLLAEAAHRVYGIY